MNEGIKKIIRDRLKRGIQSFDDLEVHKRDIFSYLRELGYEYSYKPSNIDKKNIEWGDYKAIIRRGLKSNYNLARVVRELKEQTHCEFGWRTLQYKLKETGVKIKDINKVEEWEYYLMLCKYNQQYGFDKTLEHFGLEMSVDLDHYSLAEYCFVTGEQLDECYQQLYDLYKDDKFVRGINACQFKDKKIALPYRDYNTFSLLLERRISIPYWDSLIGDYL